MPGFNIPHIDSCGVAVSDNGPSNVTETARRHRYVLEIMQPLGDKKDGVLLFGHKCTRPNIEIDRVMVHNSQDEIARPGKQHWKPVDFTFYEKLQGSEYQYNQTAYLIYNWWAKTMINVETSLHNEPSEYLRNVQLEMLDGSNNSVWAYLMYDSWPANITPTELSYSDSDISDITITLCYAKAREGFVSRMVTR